jgi:hypothetical protein
MRNVWPSRWRAAGPVGAPDRARRRQSAARTSSSAAGSKAPIRPERHTHRSRFETIARRRSARGRAAEQRRRRPASPPCRSVALPADAQRCGRRHRCGADGPMPDHEKCAAGAIRADVRERLDRRRPGAQRVPVRGPARRHGGARAVEVDAVDIRIRAAPRPARRAGSPTVAVRNAARSPSWSPAAVQANFVPFSPRPARREGHRLPHHAGPAVDNPQPPERWSLATIATRRPLHSGIANRGHADRPARRRNTARPARASGARAPPARNGATGGRRSSPPHPVAADATYTAPRASPPHDRRRLRAGTRVAMPSKSQKPAIPATVLPVASTGCR